MNNHIEVEFDEAEIEAAFDRLMMALTAWRQGPITDDQIYNELELDNE